MNPNTEAHSANHGASKPQAKTGPQDRSTHGQVSTSDVIEDVVGRMQDFYRRNPTLVLAGAGAVLTLAVIAAKSRRQEQRSVADYQYEFNRALRNGQSYGADITDGVAKAISAFVASRPQSLEAAQEMAQSAMRKIVEQGERILSTHTK